ncbi:MAG: LysR family transcriptional regulator [Burkholderiales bacterium]
MDRLTGLQIFVRVVETGSFSKAAREFNVTQPTATKHVAAIEERFGVRLLNRNSRAVSLTEAGAAYYEKCKAVLRQFDEAESFEDVRQAELTGLLRLATSLTFGRQVLAPLMIEFMTAYPKLKVDLDHDDRYVDLIACGIDVAIRLGPLADSTLGGRYLGANPWAMVAAPAYLKRHGTPRGHLDLARHDALIYTTAQGDDVWRLRSPSGERVSATLAARLRSNNLSTLAAAARAGMGITALPYYVAAPGIAAGELQVLLPDYTLPDQEIHAIFPSPKLVPAKVTTLIAFLKQRFGPQWWLAPAGTASVPPVAGGGRSKRPAAAGARSGS